MKKLFTLFDLVEVALRDDLKIEYNTLDQLSLIPLWYKPIEKISIAMDTEYAKNGRLLLTAQSGLIEIELPEVYLFDEKDFDEDFLITHNTLKRYSDNCKDFDFKLIKDVNSIIEDMLSISDEIEKDLANVSSRKRSREFIKRRDSGKYDRILKRGFTRDNLIIEKVEGNTTYCSITNIEIDIIAFFNHVDIFKVIGKNHQEYFRNAHIVGERLVKFKSKSINDSSLYLINGRYYSWSINFKDTSTVLQIPNKNSLEKLAKALSSEKYGKFNLKDNPKIKALLDKCGLDESTFMSRMDILINNEPEIVAEYAASDVFLLIMIHILQLKFFNQIRSEVGLLPVEKLKDTTGSNVATLLVDMISKHFDDDVLVNPKKKGNLFKKTKAIELATLDFNTFGIQGLETVGGLLFSRMAKHPTLKGLLGDLDLVGAYATACCNTNIYLGTPLIHSYRKNYHTLGDYLEYMNQHCYRDSWYVRVSGKLNHAINTLIYSDIDFEKKRILPTPPQDPKINDYNRNKNKKEVANSKLLTKEIKFGVVTFATIEALKTLPSEWYEEFMVLQVDFAEFIPKKCIVDTINEYHQKVEELDNHALNEVLNTETMMLTFNQQICADNICLKFPLPEKLQHLSDLRQKYKKAKNPVQEYLKLIINCIYGVLACKGLNTNNPIAANHITAMARASAWLMQNGNNGFQLITDGCTFPFNMIPNGKKFKEILAANPNYLVNFAEEYANDYEWAIENFHEDIKTHYKSFFDLEDDNYFLAKFNYALKDEDFISEKGCLTFTDFFNHGSGNYIKGLVNAKGQHEYNEYDDSKANLIENDIEATKLKARGFTSQDEDSQWYMRIMSEEVVWSPRIFLKNKIIKFSEALIKINPILEKMALERDYIDVMFPCGISQIEAKLMKIITPSQFVFKTEKQYRNFCRNSDKLGKLSDLIQYDSRVMAKVFNDPLFIESQQSISYFDSTEVIVTPSEVAAYMKNHPVGTGYEILSRLNSFKNSIKEVRCRIQDYIDNNVVDFNAKLNLNRDVEKILRANQDIQRYFILISLIRANEEKLLYESMKHSQQKTFMTFSIADLNTFKMS